MKIILADEQGENYIKHGALITLTEERMEKMRKKFICLLLVILILISGCVRQDGEKSQGNGEHGNEQQAVMGRYVEEETDLSAYLDNAAGIYKMSDGKLMVIGKQGEILTSEDNGSTWKSTDRQWIQEKAASSYIMDVKIDSKGTVGIIYAENDREDDEMSNSMIQTSLQCVLLLPDETIVPVEFPTTGSEECIDRFWISPEDQYFVSTMMGNIYEVKVDGSSKLYLTMEGSPQMIQFQGKLMIIDGYDFMEPIVYDMEKKEYIEDEVLAEFVRENYKDRGFNGSGWHNLCLFPGEEGVIFLAGKNGLHRHVVGGAAMEQIIDGKLSRLGNPQYGITGMVFLETGTFLAVSDQGKLIRFTYDPEKEAVPQEKLKIYSLKKSSDMYMAISYYQIQNPDVFVEYEVGMEEGENITEGDAIKKLNTQIMAGEGPDILILDGLPMDSYMEKGLLCDLRDVIEDFEEEMFENLVCTFEQEGKIYAVPGQVQLPVIMGKNSDVSDMKGLSTIADGIEQMRRQEPGKDLIGLCSEKAVMKLFAITSAQNWKKSDDEINRDAIEEFLTQTKRIYEAQMDGIHLESVKRFQQSNEYFTQSMGEKWVYDLSNYGYFMDYVAGYSQMFVGINHSPDSYIELASISKAKGFEDVAFVSMEGEEGRVFIPETILGIYAATSRRELAEDFLKMFFGRENQCNLSGYAVNKEAFEEGFAPNEKEVGENGELRQIGMIDTDGRETLLDIFQPTDKDMTLIRTGMESASVPYIEDVVFEQCIFEEGALFILGKKDLEETLDVIEKRLAIYIAE